ncbi:MAG: NACHT domain-containing protein [Chloroflexota bacterium]
MTEFNYNLFTPDQYEETLLRDRKAFVEYWRDDKKAEFVRDVIALANTARMLGESAYLILGVRDEVDGTPEDICGIGEMYERKIREGLTAKRAYEAIKHELAEIISDYITPLLSPKICFNKLDEKVVGYVLIPPLTAEPFRVSRELRSGRHTYLRSDQCWLRFGESKREIISTELAPAHDLLRYCYAEVPYVLPAMWQRYFEVVQSKMQSLTKDAPEETAYQELRDTKGVPISEIVDYFFAHDDEHWLILQGAAGCGKSLFLQRLTNSLAQIGEQEMRDSQRLEQFAPPGSFIPVFCQLRNLTPKARMENAYFTKTLCNLLAPLWQNAHNGRRPNHPEKLFEDRRLRWLIVLDGLDEIGAYERRCEFLNTLTEFMQKYPQIRVILSTRPVIPLRGEQAKLVEVAPLNERQIEDFLMAYRTDQNERDIYGFLQFYKKWEDARKLLSVPVYLNAALASVGIRREVGDVQWKPENSQLQSEAVINVEMYDGGESIPEAVLSPLPLDASLEVVQPFTSEPTKREEERYEEFVYTLPRLLDRVYQAFWKREEERGRLENIRQLQCGTYKLAVRMTHCAAFEQRDHAKRLFREKGLRWLLEMGVFNENEFEHIYFTIPSTQVYSAAKQVQGDVEGGFWASMKRYYRSWQETYRAEIENFYGDLTGNSLHNFLQTQGGSNG